MSDQSQSRQPEPAAGSALPPSACSTAKYRNPDPRCTYPWSPGGAGYCWSFAHHVDGRKRYEDMEKICPKCELWKPSNTKHEGRDNG